MTTAAQIATLQATLVTAATEAAALTTNTQVSALKTYIAAAVANAATLIPTPVTPTVPNAPVLNSATVSGTSVTLKWTNPTVVAGQPQVTGDDIYEDGAQITWLGYPTTGWPFTTLTQAAVTAGTHSYQVAAFNNDGVGKKSNSISVTVNGASVTPPPPPPPPPPVTGKVLLGTYTDPQGSWSNTTRFGTETGCKVSVRTEYMGRTQATAMNDLNYLLGLLQGCPYAIALGVPIVDDGYPAVFANYTKWIPIHKQVISALKASGLKFQAIRLGIELTIGTTTDLTTDPTGFVTAFNAIAPLYHAAGYLVEFNSVPNAGYNIEPIMDKIKANFDLVSTDPYDQYYGQLPNGSTTPNNAPTYSTVVENSILTAQYDGLNTLATYARANGKGMCFAEFGVGKKQDGHALGDDPNYIAWIAEFVASNADLFTKPGGYISYFDTNNGWDTILSDSPNSLAKWKQVFPAITG